MMRGSAVIAAALLAAACGPGQPAPAAGAAPAPAATSSVVTGIVPKNAIVTLLPAAGAPPVPAEPAVMDQRSKQFIPAALIVHVGQPVEFRNSEDMPHNVAVVRRDSGAELFNVGTEPNQKYVHTFDRVGQFDVKCDIHEGMEALVIAARGPITTIAGYDGRFAIANVAFGSYTASVTFAGQTVEQRLAVGEARTELKLRR
jgi:plastocyanin